jgi:proteasome lid subunit RPN8/RPN11
MTALTFRLENADWQLVFAAEALRELRKHIQGSRFSRESVGQLFSKDLTAACVTVELATRLRPTWSAWSRVRFDVRQAMAERERLFRLGWHCVGLWHTHPEPWPEPSDEDRSLSREHAVAARGHVSGLVFAILGNQSLDASLRVWLDDGKTLKLMGPVRS